MGAVLSLHIERAYRGRCPGVEVAPEYRLRTTRLGFALRILARPMAVLLLLASLANAGHAGMVLRKQRVEREGQPLAISYSVYLPEQPDAGSMQPVRFPVIYLLHGYGASAAQWLDGAAVAETLDRMIAGGEIKPVIAVMPDAHNSWYVDSSRYGGPGDYETAIVQDLVREVDRRFPTLKTSGDRAISGVSMGGFGALRLAFKHPDIFGAVVAFSPGLFKPGGLSWRHGPAVARRSNREQWYASAFGAPFDMEVYKAQSPFAYIDRVGARTRPPSIMLIVGDDDWFGSYDGTLEMFLDLRAAGLKPELRVADGGHDLRLWRSMLPEALRFLDLSWRAHL